jgi:quinoprotein glucose dehydrogenase
VIYINSNEMAWTGGLTTSKPGATLGERTYQNQCGVCHSPDRTGAPPEFPSLVDIEARLTPAQIQDRIRQGGGRMPAFNNLSEKQIGALLDYLKNGDGPVDGESGKSTADSTGASAEERYWFTGYRRFLDQDGYPAISTPWGTLNAIDLNSGKYLWKIPLGEYPALAAQGLTNTGSENYGGPVVTAGGLLFIGATLYDNVFRAFDSGTGNLLWKAELPSAGAATPATYMIDGKQYVVIIAAGHKLDKVPAEGMYLAFALP